MRTRWTRVAFAAVAFLALAVEGDLSKLLAEFESGRAEATEKHMIVPLHIYGLANRLRSLASYMQLSKRLNRRLHVSWKITPECGCELNDIFESPDRLEAKNDGIYFEVFQGNRSLLDEVIENAAGGVVNIGWNSVVDVPDLESQTTDQRTIVFALHHSWFTLSGQTCMEYFVGKSHFYRSLRPVQAVVDIVDKVWKHKLEGRAVVGVHFRKMVEKTDWTLLGQRFEDVTPLHVMADRMKDVLKRRREILFYVASNDVDSKLSLFDAKYCVSLRVDDAGMTRGAVWGIQVALAEFILLSRSELVMHTFGSSFAQEAAFFGRAPELQVRGTGGNIYQSNRASDPFCGQLSMRGKELNSKNQFLIKTNASPNSQEEVGTTTTIDLYLCEKFQQEWGVEGTFC